MITGGTIGYGETRKIADYESKTAKVELSFNLPEGCGATEVVERLKEISHTAKAQCFSMISPALANSVAQIVPVTVTDTRPGALNPVDPPKPVKKYPPKMPEPEHILSEAMKAPPPATLVEELTKLITDAEIMDATTKHQQQVKNAPAIRKLLTNLGLASPPRLVDLPQDKRQQYLDELQKIQPLA